MTPILLDILRWSPLSALLLLVVAVVAWRLEFNGEFRSRLYKLSPDDLREPAYADVLKAVLGWQTVRDQRRMYALLSVLLVALPAGLVACTPLQALARQLAPPVLFNSLSTAAGSSRSELVLVWMMFFAVSLHAAPLIVLVKERSGQPRSATPQVKDNPVIEIIVKLFAFQSYLLDRYIDDLLEYRTVGRNPSGGVSELVKQEFARAVLKAQIDPSGEFQSLVTSGDKTAIERQQLELRPVGQVLTLVDVLGIPLTRKRLGWRTDRQSKRVVVSQAVAASMCGQLLHEAWLVDVGMSSHGGERNSFLMRVPDPTEGLKAQLLSTGSQLLELLAAHNSLSHTSDTTTTFPSPIQCRIARRGHRDGMLFLGCVVQNMDIERFNKQFQFISMRRAS